MNKILTDDEAQEFLKQVGVQYRNFKKINTGNWTHEQAYRMGIVDMCDSLVYASRQVTYEVSHLRAEIEFLLDDIDMEVKK